MEIIQRNGEAWQRQGDGSWLRYDMAAGMWLPSAVSPPPPPPPPPSVADPYFPLPKPPRRALRFPELGRVVAGLDRRVAVVGLAVLIGLFGIGGAALLGGDGSPSGVLAVDNEQRKKASKNNTKHAAKKAQRVAEKKTAQKTVNQPSDRVPEKAQFIRQADALCADALSRVQAMAPPTDVPSLIAYLEEAIAINDDLTRRALGIRVPKDARAGWDRFVGHPEDGRRYRRMLDAARIGDAVELQRLMMVMQRKAARDSAWAASYGMKVCSRQTLPRA